MNVRVIVFTVCLCLTVLSWSLSAFASAAAGEAAANEVLQKFGSKEGIRNNAVNPITSSNTLMTTIDGTTSFSGQLQCPNSHRFMEVLIQPGGTGDITTFIVSQDTDFDSTPDYTYQVPFPVSGICANGVIGCDAGTWINCQAYAWTADTEGRASLQTVAITSLGGCFCINNSCGSNLVINNTDTIMNIIGGGVTGAIQKQNTRWAISEIRIDGMLASFYGQNAGSCATTAAPASSVEQYYYSPGNIAAAVTSETALQAAVTDSLYNTLNNSSAPGNTQYNTCTITRGTSIAWDASYSCSLQSGIADTCAGFDSDPGCRIISEEVDGVVTIAHGNPTGLVPTQSCRTYTDTLSASCNYACPLGTSYLCSGTGVPTCTDGTSTVNCNLLYPITSAYITCGNGLNGSANGTNILALNCASITFYPGMTVTGYASTYDPRHSNVWCYDTSDGSCFGWSGVNYASFCVKNLKVTCSGRYAGLQLQNVYQSGGTDLHIVSFGCAGSHCAGADAVFSFNANHCPIEGASGCVGSPSFCSKTCTETDCEPWWQKTRTYACDTSGYDFSKIRQRASTIKASAQDDQSAMYYTDYRLDGTEWVTEQSSYATDQVYRPAVGSCRQACKTRKEVENTATNVTYTKDDVSTTSTSVTFYYRACTSIGCPVEAGETISIDCQCIDDFANAAVIMQLLRKGGQDIICSDGTTKSLH